MSSSIRVSSPGEFDNPAKRVVMNEKIEAWDDARGAWVDISSAVRRVVIDLEVGEAAKVTLDCFLSGDKETALQVESLKIKKRRWWTK